MASEPTPYTLRWGILSCGGISKAFAQDLLLAPSTRNVHDVAHALAAAATRDSAPRAAAFLAAVGAPASAAAHGSYAALLRDPAVDIVYVGTPHSHHYAHARAALAAGKHVLVEKPATVNGAQAAALGALAAERGLFLMEAVWTRFLPVVREVVGVAGRGGVGRVCRVFADLSGAHDLEAVEPGNRLVNMDLAGGALLDIGMYSITWVFQILYHMLPQSERRAPMVASSLTKFANTGSDEAASVLLTFPPSGTQGIATTHLRVSDNPDGKHTAGPPIRIQGTLGEIQVFGPAYRPERYRVIPAEANKDLAPADVTHEMTGRGMQWEADECARCIRDGKTQSEEMDWEESLAIMKVLDEVREQNQLKYPERIESTEYPLEGFGL